MKTSINNIATIFAIVGGFAWNMKNIYAEDDTPCRFGS